MKPLVSLVAALALGVTACGAPPLASHLVASQAFTPLALATYSLTDTLNVTTRRCADYRLLPVGGGALPRGVLLGQNCDETTANVHLSLSELGIQGQLALLNPIVSLTP